MNTIHSESVSTFRNHYREVLAKVQADGPILLLQNSQVAAVLVSLEQWNAQQNVSSSLNW
ncbi:MAG: type II toxin-antitoxin system prevent-host-death family antitoxin [Caldilineaceae bacterium]